MLVDKDMDMETDPYDGEETDPSKCEAIKSCRWEIYSLQSHVLPQVCEHNYMSSSRKDQYPFVDMVHVQFLFSGPQRVVDGRFTLKIQNYAATVVSEFST